MAYLQPTGFDSFEINNFPTCPTCNSILVNTYDNLLQTATRLNSVTPSRLSDELLTEIITNLDPETNDPTTPEYTELFNHYREQVINHMPGGYNYIMWQDDPILTPLGLSGENYKGQTIIDPSVHILELMARIPENIPDEEITQWKRLRLEHLKKLRAGVESQLQSDYFGKELYFNYDLNCQEKNIPHQTDWTDPNPDENTKIRAIHIEELRRSNIFFTPIPLLQATWLYSGTSDYQLVDSEMIPDVSFEVNSSLHYKANTEPWKADPEHPQYDPCYWWGWYRESNGYIADRYLETYEGWDLHTLTYILNQNTINKWNWFNYQLSDSIPTYNAKSVSYSSGTERWYYWKGGYTKERRWQKINWVKAEVVTLEGGMSCPYPVFYYHETVQDPPFWHLWYVPGVGFVDYTNYGFWGENDEGLGNTIVGVCSIP